MTILKIPFWMVERIVQILSEHPYTGAAEIITAIKQSVLTAGMEIV